MSKNLFNKTYEVNGRIYTDNLPTNALIGLTKEQYIEYEQQKDEINQLKKRNKEIYDGFMATTQELTEYTEENERLKRENNLLKSDIEASQEIISDYKKEEEKKIPEKFKVHSFGDKDENGNFVSSPFPTDEEFMNKINDIIDFLDYLNSKGE